MLFKSCWVWICSLSNVTRGPQIFVMIITAQWHYADETNEWAKVSASHALGGLLCFLVSNLSWVSTAWSESKSKQTTKKSNRLKSVVNFLPGKSVTSQMEKDWENNTQLCDDRWNVLPPIRNNLYLISPLLSSNIQTNIFFLQILFGSIGSWNLKWINCTLQIYHWHYSFLCAKSSSTIVVCSKRDVWWLISALNAVHLASLPA